MLFYASKAISLACRLIRDIGSTWDHHRNLRRSVCLLIPKVGWRILRARPSRISFRSTTISVPEIWVGFSYRNKPHPNPLPEGEGATSSFCTATNVFPFSYD